ncbi:glutathione peroxidase [Acholeplasma hippikon]|uniref:Glutathione peroxidase n=1 Tax=Acholeplasma hippikon TaxID=264636 RepID=A0A449BI18_9MOLU|nr:redoxin domain-containing protein [Acholeplasma hippikon]VEU82085.1 Glutathione peroxidase homolog BsaA [Acholeplasma hippikon]
MSIYQIRVEDIDNKVVMLDEYKGKVLLIVNTSTSCYLTPQYEGLQSLYDKYNRRGFEVLDFPTTEFEKDSPKTIEDINKFCVDHYETTFRRFQKVRVNGDDESILYTYLKRHQKGLFNKHIKWNFTKFLVDQHGKVIKRYGPLVKPERIALDIEKLLSGK